MMRYGIGCRRLVNLRMPNNDSASSTDRYSDYNTGRLDNVRERVSALEAQSKNYATKEDIANADVVGRVSTMEGKFDYYATKEDVANAKVWLIVTWVTIISAILIGAINAILLVIRLLLS